MPKPLPGDHGGAGQRTAASNNISYAVRDRLMFFDHGGEAGLIGNQRDASVRSAKAARSVGHGVDVEPAEAAFSDNASARSPDSTQASWPASEESIS